MLLLCLPVTAQTDSPPITADNAAQVTVIERVGRGIVHDVTFSPEGDTLAVASTLGVWLYNTADLTAEPRLLDDQTGAGSVDFSPDGAQIASGGDDASVIVWDTATAEPLRALTNHVYRVDGVAFYPDSTLLASRDISGVVRVWNLATGGEIITVQNEVGQQIADGYNSDDPALNAWVDIILNTDAAMATTSAVSGNNSAQVIGGVGWLVVTVDGEQTVLDSFGVEAHGVSFDSDGSPIPAAAPATPIAYSPDGTTQAVADGNMIILTGDTTRALPGHSAAVRSLAFSPDGHSLASGGDDSRVHLWDVETGELVRSFFGHIRSIYGVAFSPDGSLLASGSLDGTIQLFNIATGESLARLDGHTGGVTGVAFNTDGTLLASSSFDGTMMVWGYPTP